jgi:hypothetical protein
MKRVMNPINRMALLTALALQGAAFGLVAPEAHAGGWDFTIVDGTGCENTGCNPSAPTYYGATAAILSSAGQTTPFYTTDEEYITYGVDFDFTTCNGKDPFALTSLDSSDNFNGPGALFDGTYYVTAYTDVWGNLFASVTITHPYFGNQLYQQPCDGGPWAEGLVSVVEDGNGLPYVFYAMNNGEIRFQRWNFSTGQFDPSAGNKCSTTGGYYAGGGSGTNLADVATALFNDQLWVFYHDTTHNCIRGQWASTASEGSSWTEVAPSGATDGCIYGGGTVNDHEVGFSPATLVDTTNQRLYVFYADSTSGSLRDTFITMNDENVPSFTNETPDSSVAISYPQSGAVGKMIAPVWNKGPQVYYIDSTNRALKYTSKTSSWGSKFVVDGPHCVESGCNSTDYMDGPIASVMREDCNGESTQPHVFYEDYSSYVLREAFWEE